MSLAILRSRLLSQNIGIGARKIKSQPDHLIGNLTIVVDENGVARIFGDLALDRQLAMPIYRLAQKLNYLLGISRIGGWTLGKSNAGSHH